MVLEVVPLAVRAQSVGGEVAAGDYAFDTGTAVMPVLWPGVALALALMGGIGAGRQREIFQNVRWEVGNESMHLV